MRNLRSLRYSRWRHPDVTAACWDPETDEVVCAVGPSQQSSEIQLIRVSDNQDDIACRTVTSWDAPSPNPDLPVDRIVSLQYLGGTGTTCLCLEGGDIVTVQGDGSSPDDGAHIEIMGSIDAGIAAARWSPDEELLTIVTKAGAVIFMSSSFDPMNEVTMTDDDLKASKHVSVGWGKKETQFQGRGAKALRDPTIPEKVDQGVLSPHDDGAIDISWRGDGAYVAINSTAVGPDGERRVIRVYSREGELDSASEPVDGFESTLSWRPAGNLMAGIQRFADRVDVVFFERNGLRHGEFRLRSSLTTVHSCDTIRLAWNFDSTVLAVILPGVVQLWTMGNYHWYLKQEVPVDPGVVGVTWHSEKALRLAIVCSTGLTALEKIFYTARGSCQPPFDNGAVAVIDGSTVKLTPFRTANVPPPMALYELILDNAAVDVAFGRRNESFAVLHSTGVDVFEWPVKNGRWTKPQLQTKVSFASTSSVGLRIACTADGNFRCMTYDDESGHGQLSIRAQAGQESKLSPLHQVQQLYTTATLESEESIGSYGQDSQGRIYRLYPEEDQIIPVSLPSQLPSFEMAEVDGVEIPFGLSRNGHLYAGRRLLAKNCTSFILTPSHAIFTTSNHLVKFIHLSSSVDALEVPADDPEKDERCRNVERGSRLVTALPTNMSIVLQMPRGNVETIFPRAMVVAGIRNLIDDKNYARAFSFCRTQRVDMNILYDHNPDQFLAHVGLFLDQIQSVSHVDLFLSSLRPEDVTQTMYKDTKRAKPETSAAISYTSAPPPKPATTTESKINTVCDTLLKALQTRKATNLQNIITSHVCKQPPALDDGLIIVAELMQEDEKLAESAVEHICFLVDVNRLYDHALGLYNLDLALLVAQQSQRDPREYLPFIQGLHDQSELRRRFQIDDHLGRHVKALATLHAMDAFDELCTYTTRHTLYQDALRLYRYEQARLDTLTELYAAHLESRSAYREAGLAYESLRNYAKATSCYQAAGASCWQECLFTAQQQRHPPLSPDAMADVATALADALWEAKDYAAAACIHLDYLNSLDQAVRCLCRGYHFAEAIRLVVRERREDLLATAVDVGIAEALGSTTEFLADCKSQLAAQLPRIDELRRRAAEDPLAFYEGERAGGIAGDIPDDVSVATSRVSTSASLFTRYTGKGAGSVGTAGTGVSRATSKNRRREEKKRARGRKGTVYEEEYLVNSVRRLIERVMSTKPEVERLVFALVRRGMAERARAAEALMGDVVTACERAVDEVFPKTQQQQQQPGGGQEEGATEAIWRARGGDGVLQEFIADQAKRSEAPIVSGMSRLALLG